MTGQLIRFRFCLRRHGQRVEGEGMKYLLDLLTRPMRTVAGATTVENGLMIALIAAICIAVVSGLGAHIGHLLSAASNALTNFGGGRDGLGSQ